MCYRVSRDFNDVDVKTNPDFSVDVVLTKFDKKYNVSITSDMPVIIPGSRILDVYKWGLIPSWSKDEKIGQKLANARSQTIDDKPSFKDSFHKRRCLIVVSGFFEWDSNKNPYYVKVKGKKIFALAGIYDIFEKEGKKIKSCSVITTSPNNKIKKLHDRMPVILEPVDFDDWLTSKDIEKVKKLLKPFNDDYMEVYPVSKIANSVKTNSPDILKPINKTL